MKKVLGLLGILLLGFVLAGCTDKDPEVTAPTLISFKIDQEEPLEGSELTRFYRGKNEMVEVEILINNPSNLPITSIVINGTNHRISKFKEESTTRKIIFDLDVGDKTGALVYSLDEIKYTNGDKTEKTLLSGSEFKIYVYKDLPSIERTDYSVGQNYIYVEFDQIDVDGVIESGTLTAQLYSGENSVETIVIGPNDVSVRFDNLLASNSYDLRFVADYDLDNNKGIKEHEVLLPLQFSTTAVTIPFAHITNIDVFSNSVTFDADFEDVDGVIVENGLNVHIFDGETSIMQQPLTESPVSITFDDEELIKNNHTYTIKIIGTYNLRDGIGDLEDNVLAIGTFTTPSKSVTSPEILELNIEENRVNFDVDIDDPLMLIVEGSLNAHIYVNGELIDSSPVINNHVDFQIFNLFANELFEIRITASYDLNDGSPLHVDEIIFTEEYTTRINEPPIVTVSEVTVRQGYITLDLNVSDVFETLKGDIVAVLKEDGVAVGNPISFGTDAAVIEFEYLVNYLKVYTIEIIADYNLRDGIGTLNDQMLYSNIIVSVEKKEPVAEIKNLVETNNSLTFNVRVMDADDTILPNTVLVYLYKDGEIDPDHSPIPVGFDSPLVTFTNLLSNY